MLKKNWSILLSGILTVGLLGGCGGGEKNPSDTAAVDKGKSFEVVTMRYDWTDKETMLKGFVKSTEEAAGINVDWKVYSNSEWQDKKSVVLISDDLPDAFLGCLELTDVSKNKALFLPLEDLIEEYMPNLSKIFEADPGLKTYATSTDGHIYGLPQRKINRMKIRYQMFINQTWLDNLGLEMPDTWKEFEDVLTAFKEKDANGNGDSDDEIPYGGGHGNPISVFILPFQHSGSGGEFVFNNQMDLTHFYMTLEDDKPVFLPSQENFKDGIRWMNECFEKGLIDLELFTQDDSMKVAKSDNKEIPLLGVFSAWTADAVVSNWADQYVALPPLAGPDGARYVSSAAETEGYMAESFWVTKNCSDPAAVLSWIDSFYTDDAAVQLTYGSFGVGTQKNDDGTYTVLAPPDGKAADSWAWENSFRGFGPRYGSDTLRLNDRLIVEVETEGDGLKANLTKNFEQYVKPEFPNLRYMDEEINILTTYYPDIETYAKTMQVKWVTEGGIDEEWSTYLQTLEQMQLKQVEETAKAAYNRFKGIK